MRYKTTRDCLARTNFSTVATGRVLDPKLSTSELPQGNAVVGADINDVAVVLETVAVADHEGGPGRACPMVRHELVEIFGDLSQRMSSPGDAGKTTISEL